MATSTRKKSVVSSVNVDIPLPTQTNTLLNKSASSSSSLYQQCSQLRARLNRIHSFYVFLEHAAAGQSVAPVDHLWDCFALGTPLCFLFNLLPPPATPIDINTDPSEVPIDPSDVRAAKKAIMQFILAVKRMQQSGEWEQSELFQVTELTDRNNLDGFVKVKLLSRFKLTCL
jgi:cell division control protein 24